MGTPCLRRRQPDASRAAQRQEERRSPACSAQAFRRSSCRTYHNTSRTLRSRSLPPISFKGGATAPWLGTPRHASHRVEHTQGTKTAAFLPFSASFRAHSSMVPYSSTLAWQHWTHEGSRPRFDAIGAQVALFGRIRHEVPVPGTVRMLARLVLEHLHAPFFQRQLELVATGDFTAVASRAELEIDVQGVLRHRHASFTSADTLRWTCLRDAKPAGLRTRPGGSAPG